MTEKTIHIDGVDPRELFGAQDTYLELIREQYPALRIVARGSKMKVMGEERLIEQFVKRFEQFEAYYDKYGHVSKEVIRQCFGTAGMSADEPPTHEGDVIVYGNNGNVIRARTANQRRLVDLFEKNDLLFAVGPAGSGKTYTAIALAVRALKNKEVKKLILCRPAVEAGEKLGFLPGDMKEKIDPYLQPLYDALEDMIPPQKLKEYMELGIIQIAPLAFMRGRTLNDAVVILDEAQNTTSAQIKMFLTRMGMNTKMIVTGDMTQIDLPHSQTSGLIQAMKILKGVKGISFVELNKKDIVRHKLVTKIVEAYEKFDKEQKVANEEKKRQKYQDTEGK